MYVCMYSSKIHREFMRKIEYKIVAVLVFICNKDTCGFMCEEVHFFGLQRINLQTFFTN